MQRCAERSAINVRAFDALTFSHIVCPLLDCCCLGLLAAKADQLGKGRAPGGVAGRGGSLDAAGYADKGGLVWTRIHHGNGRG